MFWDLQRAGLRLQFTFNWRHPALRKILALYAPIAAGLVVALLQVGLDRRLATGTHPQSVAWMSAATTLQQLPLGLISVAISVAALPRLSQYFAGRANRSVSPDARAWPAHCATVDYASGSGAVAVG